MAEFNPKKYLQNIGKGNQPRLYMPTEARIVWFRHDHPLGSIVTDVDTENGIVHARVLVDDMELGRDLATVRDGKGQTWAGRDLEKAATAAIGRALKNAGYGTLSAMVFTGVEGVSSDGDDEGDYLPDAPVEQQRPTAPESRQQAQGATQTPPPVKSGTQRGKNPYEAAQPKPAGNSASQAGWEFSKKTEGLFILRVREALPQIAQQHVVNKIRKMAGEEKFTNCHTEDDAVALVVAELSKPDMDVAF